VRGARSAAVAWEELLGEAGRRRTRLPGRYPTLKTNGLRGEENGAETGFGGQQPQGKPAQPVSP
jgi:hypothetical protein